MRGGDGLTAHQLLGTLYQAVLHKDTAVFDGQPVNFRDFTYSRHDHREVTQWLWKVLLGDGTRALTLAGHWEQALAHAEKHHGIGTRLLDGRQTAVIARCVAGDPASALDILHESALHTSWEQAVASCLAVICLTAASQAASAPIATMTEHYLASEPAPGLATFRARLGLTVVDLGDENGHPGAAHARTRLIGETVAAKDGYAAREVLASQTCRPRLTDNERQALSQAVQSSGLGTGTIPPPDLLTQLLSAVETTEEAAENNVRALKEATPGNHAGAPAASVQPVYPRLASVRRSYRN